jgi:hypothetical protein
VKFGPYTDPLGQWRAGGYTGSGQGRSPETGSSSSSRGPARTGATELERALCGVALVDRLLGTANRPPLRHVGLIHGA